MTPRRTFVHSAADLETCWRALVEPLGFGSRQIFAILIDRDGEVFRHVIHLTECPALPETEMLGRFGQALRNAMDGADVQGTCAMLWARPSSRGNRVMDIEWARAIDEMLRAVGLHGWPVHVADDSVLRVVSPDDLAA